MSEQARKEIIRRLHEDLVGPLEERERLGDRPTDRYLTGVLYPQESVHGEEGDEGLSAGGSGGGDSDTGEAEEVARSNTMRPSSAGISFSVQTESEGRAQVTARVSCAKYERESGDGESNIDRGEGGGDEHDADTGDEHGGAWVRRPLTAVINALQINVGESQQIDLSDHGIPGLFLHVFAVAANDVALVTLALLNGNRKESGESRSEAEEKCFFQVAMDVVADEGTRLAARPSRHGRDDEDGRVSDLIYRNAKEFATGHTCSAHWATSPEGEPERVGISWIPSAWVPSMSTEGDPAFSRLHQAEDIHPLSAKWIASNSGEYLVDGLRSLPSSYQEWIQSQDGRISELDARHVEQARSNLDNCRTASDRIQQGIALLAEDADAHAAFRLANHAMNIQYQWDRGSDEVLVWRPFQLGFILLALPSLVNREHEDRETMDLLWFPTGGGKTEAYFALIAFLLFFRRLRYGADGGGGTAAIMRYTLRVLTTDQFHRASALLCACDLVRHGGSRPEDMSNCEIPGADFSVGLWVGASATPNNVRDASRSLGQTEADSRPDQIRSCPACGGRLTWEAKRNPSRIEVSCPDSSCELRRGRNHRPLPIWTVDEDVYREQPSLVIGTADKFAQIARNLESGRLFGLQSTADAPDLILQDELHLISGPLGTLAGLYEIAIDEICSRDGWRPKLIGSTATIRRASEQIRALFNRSTFQFPPPGLDWDNSGFAVVDREHPGRMYLGVSTAGRSAKFTLQAASASVLQSTLPALESPDEWDPYWTLVAYFNSLRELGGALVLMQDDVASSTEQIGNWRGEPERQPKVIGELTSRVSQHEIPRILEDLKRGAGDDGAYDVVLASNMISVGMNIPRLGLMLVNGQPKTISEYIQSTSRVGRGRVPGVILTLYNNQKARDRAHFESFNTWHQTLYRQVEATSVTPFASRARDRALHAVLVSLVRHLVPDLADRPNLTPADRQKVETMAARIRDRAQDVEPDEVQGVEADLAQLIERWILREGIQSYWNDWQPRQSLLISAERAATLSAEGRSAGDGWPTPNSMRNVEPSTPFRLHDRQRNRNRNR